VSERESTPEEIAAWAGALRGQTQAKEEADREQVESADSEDRHENDPASEPEPESDPQAEAEFLAKVFAPKPGHAELIRSTHPDK
jgi:hypothetical protein